jgi:lipopolysaccharide biosynthesis regulator YciM
MEFDFSWLLWGLPLTFALGWLASRLDLRQLRIEDRLAPKAYFRGLKFLLNEQQDQAIDAFIEAVRNDPDTSELHFALGNLFRRRGEFERAVRIHEHLLSRADLDKADRLRAQHALSLDYLKAGLLDRAENALHQLEGTDYEAEALLALLSIYERTSDWQAASETARRITTHGIGDFTSRLAHYMCEQAIDLDRAEATRLLSDAWALSPGNARPGLELADLQQRCGNPDLAFATLCELARNIPIAIDLIARPLAKTASTAEQKNIARALLTDFEDFTPSLEVMDALAYLEGSADRKRIHYLKYLEREPSLVAAARLIAGYPMAGNKEMPLIQRALEKAAQPLSRYRCAACGFESARHFWRCPGCQAWDSFPARRIEEL